MVEKRITDENIVRIKEIRNSWILDEIKEEKYVVLIRGVT